MTCAGDGLPTRVVHRCEAVLQPSGRHVLHVVLPPRRPCATPLSDLRDAGHDVLAVSVLPSELPACAAAEAYGGCEHVLLQR